MKTRSLTLASLTLIAACGGTTVFEGTGASGTASTTSSTSSGSTGVGGNTTSSTGVGADTSSTGVGGFATVTVSSSAGTGGTTPVGPCPLAEPPPGTPCAAMDGQTCTYGSSVRPDCRSEVICEQGAWMSTGGTCAQFMCPSTAPTSGASCGTIMEECSYGAELCYCGCPGGLACAGPFQWECAQPPMNPGCPTIAPNAGTSCGLPDGTSCPYGTTCTPDGVIADCMQGLWTWEQVVCGG